MNPDIYALFKSYDVRGTYPHINGSVSYWVGFAFVKEILEKENIPLNINVMHDARISSPEIYAAMIKGLEDAGAQVNKLGLGSTDMLYASCQLFQNSGVMITASHNPKDDNGIKIVKKVPQMLGLGGGLETIRDSQYFTNFKEINVSELSQPQEDTDKKNHLLEYYKEKISEVGTVNEIKEKLSQKKLKVVVDTGNGMGGYVMQQVKQVYPEIEFIPLFWELDGTYPNHPADPINDDNIKDLQEKIISEHADFGIAFDGDCDRAFFVDENGNRVIGDYIMALFSKYFLQQFFSGNKSFEGLTPTIIYNIPSSRCTPDTVTNMNGKPIASKQGHNNMKANLSREKSLYGGESSGHHYFSQFSFMDGGVFAVATFINMVVNTDSKVSELTLDLAKKYLLSGEKNFHLTDQMDTDKRIKIVDSKLKDVYKDATFDYLDGISVIYPDWKFNIRLSNTEALLRLNLEVINNDGSKTTEDVNKKVDEIKNLLELN